MGFKTKIIAGVIGSSLTLVGLRSFATYVQHHNLDIKVNNSRILEKMDSPWNEFTRVMLSDSANVVGRSHLGHERAYFDLNKDNKVDYATLDIGFFSKDRVELYRNDNKRANTELFDKFDREFAEQMERFESLIKRATSPKESSS